MTLAVVASGAYLIVSEAASVNVAIPTIDRDLPGSPGVAWVLTGYLLALAVSMVAAGWTADRYGKRNVILVSMALYAVATALAAAAPTRPLLVAARVLQGLSSGGLAPVGLAYVYGIFPPRRRGFALGVWGMVATLAPATGPVVAGYLVTHGGWRWVFVANVPLVVVAVTLAYRHVPDDNHRAHRPLDAGGLLLAAIGFVAVLVGSSNLGQPPYGPSIAMLGAGLVVLALAARRTLRHRHPIIDLRILSTPVFAVCTGFIWVITVTQFAQLTLVPVQLQALRGLTPLESGLTVMPAALVAAAAMPLGGRLGDRVGARAPVAVGMVLIAGAMTALGFVRMSTPTALIVGALVVHGVGMGLALMPNAVIAMNALPIRLSSQASVFRGLNRQLAAAIGTSAIVAVVAARQGGLLPASDSAVDQVAAQDAYNTAFRVMAVVGVIGILASRLLPGAAAASALRDEREREHGEPAGEGAQPPAPEVTSRKVP